MARRTTYSYPDAIKRDIRRYIRKYVELSNFSSTGSLKEWLNDTLWLEDSVTGNESGAYGGSFTPESTYLRYLEGNFELLAEAFREFGTEVDDLDRGPGFCDSSIRCYLLSRCISEVLEERDYAKLIRRARQRREYQDATE